MLTGSCLCGQVAYAVRNAPDTGTACHCGQCRRQSGHLWASADVPDSDFSLTRDDGLRWFAASPMAKRGFCANCGSFLFWKENGSNSISFSLGSINSPTGLRLAEHIFTAHQGDYYDLNDDLPKRED